MLWASPTGKKPSTHQQKEAVGVASSGVVIFRNLHSWQVNY